MKLSEKLVKIQSELKAPKNQRNNFGKYNYRSCEDILEGVKPLLKDENISLTVSDEIKEISGRFYIVATAKITDGESEIKTTGFAREQETQKGMNEAQITGSASSYARKYALNGLFCIDDTKDADTNEQKTQTENPKAQSQYAKEDTKWFNEKPHLIEWTPWIQQNIESVVFAKIKEQGFAMNNKTKEKIKAICKK